MRIGKKYWVGGPVKKLWCLLTQYFFSILNSWSNHAERSFKITKPLTFFKCFSIWIVSKMSMVYGECKFFLHINACDPYAYLLSRIHSYQDSKVKHKWSFRFLSFCHIFLTSWDDSKLLNVLLIPLFKNCFCNWFYDPFLSQFCFFKY